LKPRVGVGILNYNRPAMTIDCLDHLVKVDWPAARLQIVVVDNASTDDSVARIKLAHPDVSVVHSSRNRGFAGGSNLAIKSMPDVDYVALLNNDALVEPGWLKPLVEVLELHPDAGAACPKILFCTRYVDVVLESETFRPLGVDRRLLGVRVSGVRVNEQERIGRCHFPSGFYRPEPGSVQTPKGRWTDGTGLLRVPFEPDEACSTCWLRVSAEKPKPLWIQTGDQRVEVEVGTMPAWIRVDVCDEPFEMINNVGSDLIDSKNSADLGIYQPDKGQFEEQQRVFAWCGCSVLLSPRYLDDVGLFDERLFLYYEDFDLSWRGQRRGWSYVYEPKSVVRHFHASTTGEYSDLFNFYVLRNRLLVLAKNAPTAIALREAATFGAHVFRHVRGELFSMDVSEQSRKLLKAFTSFLIHSPFMFFDRIRIGLRNRLRPLEQRTSFL
jgi:GT2 family glycosyltransferase